ncbi:MAG: protein O-mannosyl-transferase family [Aliarcobacter sp.]
MNVDQSLASPRRWSWPFDRIDWVAAGLVWLISQVTYFFTTQPNVGLLDSGEFLTASVHVGVPHPTGYPLWTIFSHLFTLFPIGNGAWEVNLFSGFCTAIAAGLVSLILCSSMRWSGVGDRLAQILAVGWSVALAFSVSMWSQAVIAEVYGTHVLCVMLLLWVIYRWVRDPSWTMGLAWAVFFFALGMTNHHLTITLSSLPVLVMLLRRRDFLAEGLLYLSGTAALVYLGFGYLSQEPASWHASVRFLLCVFSGFVFWFLWKRQFQNWRVGVAILGAVFLGLSPYIYMPLASATNPPMNWGFASTKEGFFYSFNRSQYDGKLSDQLLKTIGRAMGSAPVEMVNPPGPNPNAPAPNSFRENFLKFAQLYWRKIVANFSPFGILALVGTVAALGSVSKAVRDWLGICAFGLLLSGFLQPAFAEVGADEATWLLQMPYLGYSYAFFVLLAGFGSGWAIQRFSQKEKLGWAVALLFGAGLAGFSFRQNLNFCSQREHWFGWMYGRDMLSDLPKDSFVFGGTDPGRFVPTYMILSESFEPKKFKRDQSFDRRDLYIITQNALADAFYNQYIRNHYSTERPSARGWVDKWLGRDKHFPVAPLVLPRQEDIMAIYQGAIERRQKDAAAPDPNSDPTVLNSMVGEWIWQRNKDQRAFFVEESFPMEWSYPNAVPHGLCYEIKKDPVAKLTPEMVKVDMQYWREYIDHLMKTPGFEDDIDAQRSFSKLRNTGGNIYKWRKMPEAAEQAYRQALELWPGNTETLNNFTDLLMSQGRAADLRDLLAKAAKADPNNGMLTMLLSNCEHRIQLRSEIAKLEDQRATNSKDVALYQQLLAKVSEEGDRPRADSLIREGTSLFPTNVDVMRDAVNYFAMQNRVPQALEYGRKLERLAPEDAEVKLGLAKFSLVMGKRVEFYQLLKDAIRLGGLPMREKAANEPLFQQIISEPDFQSALRPPNHK